MLFGLQSTFFVAPIPAPLFSLPSLTKLLFLFCRQSSSSSHCGSVADEPDTRSSPGAGGRYPEDNPPDLTIPGNSIKNNGFDRSGSNEDMMDRLPHEQGAEGKGSRCMYREILWFWPVL